MSVPERLFHRLQVEQKRHDQEFHPDIYYLDYPRRMTHFVLHFAKYAGRLASLPDDAEKASQVLRQTLADSFIVILAASDVLNIDFDKKLREVHGEPREASIPGWCAHLAGGHGKPRDVPTLWLMGIVPPTGVMSKALESLDHMEPINVRGLLADGLMSILGVTLAVAHHMDVDLEKLTRDRWEEVAKRRLL